MWADLFSPRVFGLLFNSVLLAITVSAVALFIALGSALIVFRARSRLIEEFGWVALFLAAIPPYVQSSVWTELFFLTGIQTQGFFPAFWVQVVSFLPLAILLIFTGISQIENQFIEQGLTISPGIQVIKMIVIPLARPYVFSAFGILFVLSVLDYSVPTIFQFEVYSLEIQEEFSATGEFLPAILKGLLLTLMAGPMLFYSLRSFLFNSSAGWSYRHLSVSIDLPPVLLVVRNMMILLVTAMMIMPLAMLFIQSGSIRSTVNALHDHLPLVFRSLFVAGMGALVSVLVAFFLANKSKLRNLIFLIVVICIALPPPLVGLAFQFLCAQGIPICDHLSILVLVDFVRFGPFAVIIIYLFRKGLSPSLFDAGQLASVSKLRRILSIDFRLLLPGIFAGFLLILILGLGEVGASMAVMPPGGELLSTRIFNYLHYGASEMVSGLTLGVYLFVLSLFSIHLVYRYLNRVKSNE